MAEGSMQNLQSGHVQPTPGAARLYGRAMARMMKGSGAGRALPAPLTGPSYKVPLVAQRLEAFRRHCRLTVGGMPLPYLFVLANGPQLALLNRSDCPYPAAGLVQRNGRFEWSGTSAFAPPDFVLVQPTIRDLGAVDGGRDIEISCAIHYPDGMPLGQVVSGFRVRGKKSANRTQKSASAVELIEGEAHRLTFEKGRGGAYARISGDWNPIHLNRLSARAFGFSRPIVHGLDALTSSLAFVEGLPARRISVSFRKPVLTPAKTLVLVDKREGETRFALVSDDTSKTHLTGVVET